MRVVNRGHLKTSGRGLNKPVLDEFYSLHGWDPETGWPTRETLETLGLRGVHEQMIAGARAAAERQG